MAAKAAAAVPPAQEQIDHYVKHVKADNMRYLETHALVEDQADHDGEERDESAQELEAAEAVDGADFIDDTFVDPFTVKSKAEFWEDAKACMDKVRKEEAAWKDYEPPPEPESDDESDDESDEALIKRVREAGPAVRARIAAILEEVPTTPPRLRRAYCGLPGETEAEYEIRRERLDEINRRCGKAV